MKKIYTLISALVLSLAASAQCSEIFFSEYAEGSSNNKYIEIFNPTKSAVDLSDYSIIRLNGGSSSPDTFGMNGMLEPSDVYIIANSSADTTILKLADTTGSATFYNGDDALSIYKHSTMTIVDVFGVPGTDPGSEWTVGSGTTKEHTLVRMSSVSAGQTDWSIGAKEWDVYSQNEWSYAGSHRSACTGIQNAGYDIEGDDSYRDHWRNRDFEDQIPNTNLLQITSSPVHSGAKAGKFPSSGERIAYQAVVVKPNTSYKIKFWYTIKTSNTGSIDVHILEGDIRDTANVSGALINTKTVNDQTDANTYVQDSVEFTSGSKDVIAIYVRNSGEEARMDTWEIIEGQAAAPAAILNPGFDIEGDDSYRDNWRNSAFEDSLPGTNLLQITSSPIHMGVKAAKLPSDGARIMYQALDVSKNTDYKVTFWYTMKTSPKGSATVAILGKDLVDPDMVASNTIKSLTVNDQTDANVYLKDSVMFNSGSSNRIAIYVTNTGVETRFDTWEILENTTPPFAPVIQNPGYDIEGNDSYRDHWTNGDLGGTIQITGSPIHMGVKGAKLPSDGSRIGYQAVKVEPSESYMVTFWYTMKTSPTGSSKVAILDGHVTDTADVSTKTLASTMISDQVDADTYVKDSVYFKAKSDTIAIFFTNTDVETRFDTWEIYKSGPPVKEDPIPVYHVSNIVDAIQLDGDLSPTNLDTLYELTGVVYGIDLDGNAGLSFTIIDSTGGINVFNFVDVNDYVVTEGDEITARGKIAFYNGLLELMVDSIIVNSTSNTLAMPTMVTKPSEATESMFIQLEKVWIADTTTVWPNNGNVLLTNDDQDTFQIRIDRDIPGIVGMAVAYDTMTIVGIGGQFDNSAPYTSGYQIFPRGIDDILEWKDNSSVKDLRKVALNVYPNPTQGKVYLSGNISWDSYRVYNMLGVEVLAGKYEGQALNLEGLVNGYYLIKTANKEVVGVTKVILSK
jgi:hypothetical protein